MKVRTQEHEVLSFTVSEVAKALKLKIPKSKGVTFNEGIDFETGEAILEIWVDK